MHLRRISRCATPYLEQRSVGLLSPPHMRDLSQKFEGVETVDPPSSVLVSSRSTRISGSHLAERAERRATDLQLKPAASKESAGLGHLAAVCWPLVLRACGRSRSERRWGSRARARDFFPATQLKKRFCTKKHRQRAARFLGLLGKSRRCVAQLSVRGAHFVPGRWSPCLLALLVLVLFWFLAPPHFWYIITTERGPATNTAAAQTKRTRQPNSPVGRV